MSLKMSFKMRFRMVLYHALVNRVPGIRERYQNLRRSREGTSGRLYGWAALLGWNIRYHLFGDRALEESPDYPESEQTPLPLQESEEAFVQSPKELAEHLLGYDLISFDLFDTLILRPFFRPSDLFYFLGIRLQYPDFRRLRMEAEERARAQKQKQCQSREVTLAEIWQELERMTGLSAKEGQRLEWKLEQDYCIANPYFQEVFRLLGESGEFGEKLLILTSDMYLSRAQLSGLIRRWYPVTFDRIFLSCEHGESKSDGKLYERICRTYPNAKRRVHVGDQKYSDREMAGRHGFDAVWYPNVQESGRRFRTFDMSAITGSMYRGIVNNRLYAQAKIYPPFYEFGYIYGGLSALGYCRFIHAQVKRRGIEKVLFLARDGEILKKVYDFLYPGENTSYLLWSRLVAVKLTADRFRYDFFRRFLFHKVNQGYSLQEIFRAMELEQLLPGLCEKHGFQKEDTLTESRAVQCRDYLLCRWDEVLESYRAEKEAAKQYLREMLAGCSSAAAVDIGWAGSGALSLDYLVNTEWEMGCLVYGLIAGTNSRHNAEPDTSEGALACGRLTSYLYSQQQNRDLWKFHNPGRGHNLWLELLFSSASLSLKGFYLQEDQSVGFRFSEKREISSQSVEQIQQGILDFARDWQKSFGALDWEISGRDAYAPLMRMLRDREYLKKLSAAADWKPGQNLE